MQAVGGTTVVALVLTALLVAGLWQLARSSTIDDLRRRASVPVALLACGPVLFALTAQVRWGFGLEEARASRYVYIGAVLLLPALALAGDAIARRWRSAMVPVVALLLVSVPGNISDFNSSTFDPRYFDAQRQTVLGLARTDLAERVPRSVRPLHDPFSADEVTIGWLLDLRDEGRLPDAGAIDPRVEALFPIRLGLAQVDGPLVAPMYYAHGPRRPLAQRGRPARNPHTHVDRTARERCRRVTADVFRSSGPGNHLSRAPTQRPNLADQARSEADDVSLKVFACVKRDGDPRGCPR